ncbi:unnamed protein product [Adineta ricciae]|uniref:Uncharacterized protein n=1 Tax=Adineta ricciae TaxID=249248 RepID=A0A813ZND8_ADIRI|nr:unnamed protein product [Adineta ricciae]CAF0987205.1 unnamed protein product [Adineta ricciae]
MSRFEDAAILSHYQFSRSAASTSRPQSSIPAKDAVTDMFNIGMDNRQELNRSESLPFSIRRVVRHQVRVPTASLVISSTIGNPRSSTPEHIFTPERPLSAARTFRLSRSMPVRLKSTPIIIPPRVTTDKNPYQDFPKQNHEKRKLVHDRKRRKQERQFFSDKSSETETWNRLRRSLVELKRLATTQDVLIDPTTSLFHCDGHTCTEAKPINKEQQQEEKRAAAFKSESATASLFSSGYSRELTRRSLTASQGSFFRPASAKRPTETYPRPSLELLLVGSKPIHSVTDKGAPLIKPRERPPATAPPRSRLYYTTALPSEDKHPELIVTDHSDDAIRSLPSTPTPPLPVVQIESELPSPPPPQPPLPPRKIVTPTPTRTRPPSSIPVSSTIKLKSHVTRCRSATDVKATFSISKNYPRFIVIADEDHRIESWYHQYPFVLGDDLLCAFESKPSPQKSTISAYFIDDAQTANPNITAKTFLQGKPFHINNDWKRYDLIFISNNISEKMMNYLKIIVNSMKSSGKIIKICQVNHNDDLKKQVRNICKQAQQENF